MARLRYEAQRRLYNSRNESRTLESQLNPEAELELSQRRRASLVPVETLYSTNWNVGVNALIVLRDTHWRDDRSIIGTMEVDLSGDETPWENLVADEEEDNADDEVVFPSVWEDTPWEEDPDLDPNDLAPTNEDEKEDLESYLLGLSNLETDYPIISPNSILPDDDKQLPPYWDNSDTESEEYWQQVIEEVEQIEEQFYTTQTNNFPEKMNELSVQEETSSTEEEPNDWLSYANQDQESPQNIQSTEEATHVDSASYGMDQWIVVSVNPCSSLRYSHPPWWEGNGFFLHSTLGRHNQIVAQSEAGSEGGEKKRIQVSK
ncbi:hypothetical protein ZIOFF_065224 [Zingiber officinale]|uniref:Uncharacterized protein n=1 Tax=Zingiber officinale TaxID=94328 RepID=A0A8J5EX42_ZINOF|nr:hypothetical protein ZIOFF_065224 [Zingiber officinale]